MTMISARKSSSAIDSQVFRNLWMDVGAKPTVDLLTDMAVCPNPFYAIQRLCRTLVHRPACVRMASLTYRKRMLLVMLNIATVISHCPKGIFTLKHRHDVRFQTRRVRRGGKPLQRALGWVN